MFKNAPDESLQLDYTLRILNHQQIINQRYYAASEIIHEKYEHIDLLWRLLAQHTRSGKDKIRINTYQNKPINLNLTIAEEYRSKDSETKLRNYEVKGEEMTVTFAHKGRFREEKKALIILTKDQQNQLFQLLQQEQNQLSYLNNPQYIKASRLTFVPIMRGNLEASINGQTIKTKVVGGQFELMENIPFVLLEVVEKVLDPNNDMQKAFKQGIFDRKFAEAYDRYHFKD